MTDTPHPLDNVFWSALTTRQASFSLGGDRARRFDPVYAYFGGMPAFAPENLAALAELMSAGELVSVFMPEGADAGPLFEAIEFKTLVQMLGPTDAMAPADGRFVELGAADLPRMLALVQVAKPGPWFERSAELGRFIGCEDGGRLVAMAGERLKVPGYTEISAVCTDPDWRGRGLGTQLTCAVSQSIRARGDRPFLHVRAGNAGAIALYQRLGFTTRCTWRSGVLRRR